MAVNLKGMMRWCLEVALGQPPGDRIPVIGCVRARSIHIHPRPQSKSLVHAFWSFQHFSAGGYRWKRGYEMKVSI